MNGFERMAQTLYNAEDRFAEYAQTTIGCSREDAFKIAAYYRKLRLIKFDAVSGDFHVKHGAFLDAEVLRRAKDLA